MKWQVGALSAPEAPRVDASTIFVYWQRAIIDVAASFGVLTGNKRICNCALLPAIITNACEVIVVDA